MAYGLVIALAMIIINVVLYVLGMSLQSWSQYISYVPFLIGIILEARAFSASKDGYVTFGQVFGSAYRACAIITLITLVWSFIFLMIFPDMIDKAMEMAREKMEQNGQGANVDMAMDFTRKYFKIFMVAGVIFGTMFWGAIFSLIGAAIAPKKPIPMDKALS